MENFVNTFKRRDGEAYVLMVQSTDWTKATATVSTMENIDKKKVTNAGFSTECRIRSGEKGHRKSKAIYKMFATA